MKVNGLAVFTSLSSGAFKSYLDLSDKKPCRFFKVKEGILALREDAFDQKYPFGTLQINSNLLGLEWCVLYVIVTK